MTKPGFTLAELLIALALLGIIAAFTIPKVLQSSAEHEKLAKLRETVSALEQIGYDARRTRSGGSFYDYIQNQMNALGNGTGAVETGPLPASHPCSSTGPNFKFSAGWVQLANGVVISGMSAPLFSTNPSSDYNSCLCIDINGAAAPNLAGQDVFIGNYHMWGDFDESGPAYQPRDNAKAFNWGNATQEVYGDAPASYPGVNIVYPPLDAPEARVGYWLTR